MSPRRRPTRPPRPWILTALGWLLLAQAAALIILGTINLMTLEPLMTDAGLVFRQPHKLLSGVLIWLAALAALSAFNLFRQRRGAWSGAMLLQGLMLLTALVLHFRDHEAYAYGMMGYGIFMVVYLNYAQRHSVPSTAPPQP